MLKSLSISNYALIESVEIVFDDGLSVITGETGAGKSILLGALSLILGQRSDVSALLDADKKCVVEGIFQIHNPLIKAYFLENDVDYDVVSIIRREVLPNGKSRAFVNDTPVNLNFLKDIGNLLIDVHSQHQNLLLSNNDFHMMVVDSMAKNRDKLESYLLQYGVYKKLKAQIELLIEENNKQKADLDYMQFQYQQLFDAHLKEGEQAVLEFDLEQLNHAEEIKSALVFVTSLLGEEPNAVVDALQDAVHKLDKVSAYLPDGAEWKQRIQSAYIDLKDLNSEIVVKADSIEFDAALITKVQQRLDLIYSLQQKNRVGSVEELIVLRDELAAKIDKVNLFDAELGHLQNKLIKEEADLKLLANSLSASRQNVFKKVSDVIELQLADLGMAHARFVVEHMVLNQYTPQGSDRIEFLFAANKNGQPSSISKVASGGEMSRVMLSIKSLLSAANDLPTIIFDEIDTGVSGEVADKMGVIMADMAKRMQVISITHLPQITVKGKNHYKVYKVDNELKTISHIVKLDSEERVVEVAKMLSGSQLTDEALKNARSLLNN